MKIALLFLTALLITPCFAAASQPHPLAVKALDGLDSFEDDRWSYTKTTTSKNGIRVERHDASQPAGQRWTLVRINGKQPTAQEVEEHRKEKAEDLNRRNDERESDKDDVDRSSIRLVEETPGRAIFTFRSRIDGKLEEKILGTLVVNKGGAWAERFELENTGVLRPIPGVRISAFNLRMTFQRLSASREIVPEAIEMHVRGRAFLVKSLDEDRTSRYSEFEKVADGAPE